MPEIAGIGVLSAFLAGLVSFLSPCVLPMVPGYVSYIAGQSLSDLRAREAGRARLAALGMSLSFVLGFSAVFIALGAGASAIGGVLRAYMFEASYVAGAVIIVFGLFMMGIFKFPWANRDIRPVLDLPGGQPASAFLLGASFAFGWTPCIGPILGAILTISASSLTVSEGVALLSVYSLGLAVPFLLVAAFTDRFMTAMAALRLSGRRAQAAAGGVLVLIGTAMMTGYLTRASTWMLKTFPALQGLVL